MFEAGVERALGCAGEGAKHGTGELEVRDNKHEEKKATRREEVWGSDKVIITVGVLCVGYISPDVRPPSAVSCVVICIYLEVKPTCAHRRSRHPVLKATSQTSIQPVVLHVHNLYTPTSQLLDPT